MVAEIANSSKSNKTRKVVEAVELINLWNSRCKTSDNCNDNEVVIVAEVMLARFTLPLGSHLSHGSGKMKAAKIA